MAKTKGYNPPETEFAYDDATGDRHYFGEFLRMVLGEGSISPRDPETDIIGKARRGERPSQQGEGTDPQAFYRKIFRNCSKMWNALPEDCPPTDCVGLPPGTTSKKEIWNAKLEHGVVCSYYDLLMRCCILFAVENNGEMPTDECFPCQAIDPEMSWDYETNEEEIDREGSGAIAITGLNGPFVWEVSGVGFTLEHAVTEGAANILHADGTACGAAEILVVGCDDKHTTGYVRCTTGRWVFIGETCPAPGPITSQNGNLLIRVQGRYKVQETAKVAMSIGAPPCPNDDCNAHCSGPVGPFCLTGWDCKQVDNKLREMAPLMGGCCCTGAESPWTDEAVCMHPRSRAAYSWEC